MRRSSSSDPTLRDHAAAPVGDVLSDVLRRVDPEQHLRGYALWTFWNEEVGPGIARRAQPARFRNGILFVTVATHSWMQELQFMKDTLREKLNARLGAPVVRDIFFVSGNVATDATAPEPPLDARRAAESPDATLPLPPIADPALAAAFARLVAARARRLARVPPAAPKPKR